MRVLLSNWRQSGKGRLIWDFKWKIIYFFSLSDLKEKRERRELLSGYNLEELQAEQERGHYASSVKKYIRWTSKKVLYFENIVHKITRGLCLNSQYCLQRWTRCLITYYFFTLTNVIKGMFTYFIILLILLLSIIVFYF